MFCPACGTKLEENAKKCCICGCNLDSDIEFSPENSATETIHDPTISSVEHIATKNKSKTVVIVSAIIAVILLAALSIFAYLAFGDKNTDGNDVPIKPSTESTKEVTTKELATEPTTPSFNANDYLGYWHMKNNDKHKLDELAIHSITDDQVEFSLWYYRLDSIDHIMATLDGNVASFSDNYDEQKIKGTLVFKDSSIIVNITESDHEYMPVETRIFDGQHGTSWGVGDDLDNYDDSDAYEDTSNNGPGDDYGEKPNVWCPNCGYGFFTTGVGNDGLDCPICGQIWMP